MFFVWFGGWFASRHSKRNTLPSSSHTIPATQTPASLYVHKGDLKLVRFFADDPSPSDNFELYNLADEIVETKNLAPKMQAQVKKLNALIPQQLKEKGALVPFANPNYSGSTKDIDGWSAGGTATLQRVADVLQVNPNGWALPLHWRRVISIFGPKRLSSTVSLKSK